MARSGDPNSASSQFYILKKDTPSLDGQYAVFGMVVQGMDVVDQIQIGDKMTSVKE
jgi:cyclophilin family peptidyl-prolyl cis-trans isomerase